MLSAWSITAPCPRSLTQREPDAAKPRCAPAQGVRTVVHYQVPASADVYVHRSGRTGRAGAEGIAIALVTPKEAPRYAALLQVPNLRGRPHGAACCGAAGCRKLHEAAMLHVA